MIPPLALILVLTMPGFTTLWHESHLLKALTLMLLGPDS